MFKNFCSIMIFIIMFLAVNTIYSQYPGYVGIPPYFWIATFHPGDAGYQNNWANNNSDFVWQLTADEVRNRMSTALQNNYYPLGYVANDYKGANFNYNDFNSILNQHEFAFIYTHGNHNSMTFWPDEERGYFYRDLNPIYMSGWNRIVLAKVCLLLYSTNYIDNAFKGGHSLSGSKSSMNAKGSSYRHRHCYVFCGKHKHSYTDNSIGKYFSEYFINQKKSVWESWRVAIQEEQYDYTNVGAHPTTCGVHGYVPSMGKYYDTTQEKFETMYNGALWLNEQDRNNFYSSSGEVVRYGFIITRHEKFGSPNYDGVKPLIID